MIFKRGGIEEKSAPIFVVDSMSESRSWSRPGMEGIEFSAPLYIHGDGRTNTGMAACRQQKTDGFHHVFVSDSIIESSLVSNKTAEITSSFPLYTSGESWTANFDLDKVQELFSDAGRVDDPSRVILPEDIFDYTYASLHSPSYRETYKEFLKTDFPRVPRPTSWANFWKLVDLGRELRELHLMKSPIVDNYDTTYSEAGSDEVEKVQYVPSKMYYDQGTSNRFVGSIDEEHSEELPYGNVYINDTQFFGNVPKAAWEFYIGGYQPAQKWLKDRKGRKLSNDDIDHYQRIIKILIETDRIMKEIDKNNV